MGIHQNRKIQEVTIHPLYTGIVNDDPSDVMNYNFALLHLEKDFDFYPHISHVCLPEFPEIKTGKKTLISTILKHCNCILSTMFLMIPSFNFKVNTMKQSALQWDGIKKAPISQKFNIF